jgi:PAS domain-containing protein
MTNAQGNVEKIYTLMERHYPSQTERRRIDQIVVGTKQSPVSIVITNLDGNIEYVNSKFTEVNGLFAEEVIGQNPRILKSGDTPQEGYKIDVGNHYFGQRMERHFSQQTEKGDCIGKRPIFFQFKLPMEIHCTS